MNKEKSWKIRLLTASYISERVDDGAEGSGTGQGADARQGRDTWHSTDADLRPVILLFGKTEDGRSVAVKYHGFLPYLYLVEPPDSFIADMKRSKNIVSIEP